jgi:hypothetical protein
MQRQVGDRKEDPFEFLAGGEAKRDRRWRGLLDSTRNIKIRSRKV